MLGFWLTGNVAAAVSLEFGLKSAWQLGGTDWISSQSVMTTELPEPWGVASP
jgi:hypothetical protein